MAFSFQSVCFSLLVTLLQLVSAADHIVIIDRQRTGTPDIDEVLRRVDLHSQHPNVSNIWNNSAFLGFSASIRPTHIGCLQNMSDILLVEKSVSIAHAGVIKRDSNTLTDRTSATWGLARISTAFFRAAETLSLGYDYTFKGDAPGQGTDIYVLDSGIWTDHHGFQGRAKMIFSFDGVYNDTDGHGTHVAGTAGAIDFGVASNANIYGVRVLDAKGNGSSITVINGIDYVVTQHDNRKQNSSSGFVGSVIQMSLAADTKVSALDQAVASAIDAGIHVCVAAGNSASDACGSSPSLSGGKNGPAITVGSVDIEGQHSSFSNYGDCVDLYAPGEDVLSAGLGNPDLLVAMSGTSMATPHVSGLIAYAMSDPALAASPAAMKKWLLSNALPIGDGTFLANNGANSDTSGGMIGADITTVDGRSTFISNRGISSSSKRGTSGSRGAPNLWTISDRPSILSS